MREEMEKSCQHEMKLFELMLNHRASGSYGHCFDGVPSSSSMAYGTWHKAQQHFCQSLPLEALSHLIQGNTSPYRVP